MVSLYIFKVVSRVELSNFIMKLDKRLKWKQKKRSRGKVPSCTWFYFFSFFFIRQNVKVSVVHGNACRVVHGFMSDASIRSATLSCTSLRPTAARGCTSEYFNCANSSCCTVSELVMCIKPSAQHRLLLVRIYFLPSLSLRLLLFRLRFFLEEIGVERGSGYFLCCL